MKQVIFALLLVALLSVVTFANAQEQLADRRPFRPVIRRQYSEEQADFKFKKFLKKVANVAKTVGKAYITAQTGIPLADASQIDLKEVVKAALPYIKSGVKQYINNNWDNVEQADADFKLKNLLKKVGKVAKTIGKQYIASQYGITLADSQSAKFWKSIAKIAKQVGKQYVANKYGITLADSQADFKFKKLLKKVANVAKTVGKAYITAQTGIPLADASQIDLKEVVKAALPYIKSGVKQYINNNWDNVEQADADFKLKNLLKKVGKVAKTIGKQYIASQYGITLADSQSAKFWKSIAKIAKQVGKQYVANKYGITLADRSPIRFRPIRRPAIEEQADFKFKKLLKKVAKIAKTVGKAYITSQTGIPLADAQSEKFWKSVAKIAKNIGKQYVASKYGITLADAQADFKLKKILKKVGKVATAVGKAYITAQTGIPLADN